MRQKDVIDTELAALGQSIKAFRIAASMKQESLAEAAGIDRSYFGKMERGEVNFSMHHLFNVCRALGTPPSLLMAVTDGPVLSGKPHSAKSLKEA